MYGIAPYIPRLLVDRLEQPVCGIGVVRGEGEPDLDQTVRGPVGTANDSDAPLASLVILGGPRIAAARGLAAHAGALALFASSAPSRRGEGVFQSPPPTRRLQETPKYSAFPAGQDARPFSVTPRH
jgi:hypothetical protein